MRSAVELDRVWVELRGGPAILRGAALALAPGETVALMGRNGAGKSTLLRVAAGLTDATRGRVRRDGRVALLMQNPGDYFLAERVGDELPEGGLDRLRERHPRDLSGGERQLLALEIVLRGEAPAAVLLDEPTRGMDRAHKHALAARLQALALGGAAVVVATHDAEFAAEVAARTVLLADGAVIADGPTRELLTGGWYFATQVARVLPGVLTPEEGAVVLTREAVG